MSTTPTAMPGLSPEQTRAQVVLEWQGPFRWFAGGDASIFEGPCAEVAGVYAWTIPVKGASRVFHVGLAESGLAYRHHQLFQEYFAGEHSVFDPQAFLEGRLDRIYQGNARHPRWRLATGFYRRAPELAAPLLEQLDALHIYLAPIPERRTQQRVESALVHLLRTLEGPAGKLFEPELHIEPRHRDESPVSIRQTPAGLLEGLPEFFTA